MLGAISLSLKRGSGAGQRSLGMQPAASAFGMRRCVKDADDVEIIVRLFVHDDVGKMGNGEFVRAVNGVAAAWQEIQCFVDDAMNASYDREGRNRIVTRAAISSRS